MTAPYQQDFLEKYEEAHKSPMSLLSKRLWAFNIDFICITLINKGIFLAFQSFIRGFYYQLHYTTQLNIEQNIHSIAGATFLIVFWGYFHFSYFLGEGKTPGKHFMGVVAFSPKFVDHGEPHLSLKESTMRTLGHLCSIMFLLPFIVPLLNKQRKSFSDFISGTYIITEEQMLVYEQKYQSMMSEKLPHLWSAQQEETDLEQMELDFSQAVAFEQEDSESDKEAA